MKENGYAPLDSGVRRAGPCRHALPPERPTSSGDGDQELELVLASGNLDFGDARTENAAAPGLTTLGYDLDGTCTGQGEPESCKEPPWASSSHEDGTDGRDNGMVKAFYELLHGLGSLTMYFGAQAPGKQAMLLRLRGYDGLADDSHVQLDMFAGTLWSPDDTLGPEPLGDARDQWGVGSAWLERTPGVEQDVGRSRYRDDDAYVRDGIIVARFPSLLTGDAYIPAVPLYGTVVTGRLLQDGDSWFLRDAVLAGRCAIEDLTRLMSYSLDVASHQTLCADSPAFKEAKSAVCSYVDIRVEGDDGTDEPCDGMSVAFGFEAVPASLGVVVRSGEGTHACTPNNDPATHGCGVP